MNTSELHATIYQVQKRIAYDGRPAWIVTLETVELKEASEAARAIGAAGGTARIAFIQQIIIGA